MAIGNGIRWARGLFRLWLVLSMMWLGGVIFVERPDTVLGALLADQERARAIAVTIEARGVGLSPNLASEGAAAARAAVAAFESRGQEPPDSLVQELEAFRRAIVMHVQIRLLGQEAALKRERLRATAWLVVLPPAVLFFIGATLLWALRGFRRDG